VIGNASTGKSCLLHQFIENKCTAPHGLTLIPLPLLHQHRAPTTPPHPAPFSFHPMRCVCVCVGGRLCSQVGIVPHHRRGVWFQSRQLRRQDRQAANLVSGPALPAADGSQERC
jgi:hypothetical protein